MSIFWTYNKRRWGTTIADGRKNKWYKRTGEPFNLNIWSITVYNTQCPLYLFFNFCFSAGQARACSSMMNIYVQ